MKRDRILTRTVSHATSKNQKVVCFFSVFSFCFVQNFCDQSDQQRGTMHVLVVGSGKCKLLLVWLTSVDPNLARSLGRDDAA